MRCTLTHDPSHFFADQAQEGLPVTNLLEFDDVLVFLIWSVHTMQESVEGLCKVMQRLCQRQPVFQEFCEVTKELVNVFMCVQCVKSLP